MKKVLGLVVFALGALGCNKDSGSDSSEGGDGSIAINLEGAIGLGVADDSSGLHLNSDGSDSNLLRMNVDGALESALAGSNISYTGKVDRVLKSPDNKLFISFNRPIGYSLLDKGGDLTICVLLEVADDGKASCMDTNTGSAENLRIESTGLYYRASDKRGGDSYLRHRDLISGETKDIFQDQDDFVYWLVGENAIVKTPDALYLIKSDGSKMEFNDFKPGTIELPKGKVLIHAAAGYSVLNANTGEMEGEYVMPDLSEENCDFGEKCKAISDAIGYFGGPNSLRIYSTESRVFIYEPEQKIFFQFYPTVELAATEVSEVKATHIVGDKIALAGKDANGKNRLVILSGNDSEVDLLKEENIEVQTMSMDSARLIFSGLRDSKQVSGTIDLNSLEVTSQESSVKLSYMQAL